LPGKWDYVFDKQCPPRGRDFAERGRSPSAALAVFNKSDFSVACSCGDPLRAGMARTPGAAAIIVVKGIIPINATRNGRRAETEGEVLIHRAQENRDGRG
jgi:hypothetical protein